MAARVVARFGALVLYAADPERTAGFYRALGVPLEDEDHGEGPVHAAADLSDVHVAVYPAESGGRAPARRAAGSAFVGFYVDSLDEAALALRRAGATQTSQHEQMPWGCRVVFEDPDGRQVEVNQQGHCA